MANRSEFYYHYPEEMIAFIKSKSDYADCFQGRNIEKIEDLKKVIKIIASYGGRPVKNDIIRSAR